MRYNQGKEKRKIKRIYKEVNFTRSFWFFWFKVLLEDMLEKDIVAAILRHLRGKPRCFAWKTHGGMYGTAGIPDIVACIDGRFYGFEVKQPSGKLTRLQEITLKKIEDAGGRALKVTSVEEVEAAISEGGFL